jgi:flagellar assembly factor FliW
MSVFLSFVSPPPGLEPLTDFALTSIDGADGLYTLQALKEQGKRLFVLDAAVYLPEYTPVITEEQCAALEVTKPDDTMVLVVANPGEAGTTVNLMAPIVVNKNTLACDQVILEGQDWSLRAELTARAA